MKEYPKNAVNGNRTVIALRIDKQTYEALDKLIKSGMVLYITDVARFGLYMVYKLIKEKGAEAVLQLDNDTDLSVSIVVSIPRGMREVIESYGVKVSKAARVGLRLFVNEFFREVYEAKSSDVEEEFEKRLLPGRF